MQHLGLEFSPTWAWSGDTDYFFSPVRLWLDTSSLAVVARFWQNIATIEFEHRDLGKKKRKQRHWEKYLWFIISYSKFLESFST